METDCGSHTHTAIPERDRILIYVQSYDLGAGKANCDAAVDPHDKISIVNIPKRNPANARIRGRAGALPGRRQRRHDGHAARDHRLPRHHRLPGRRPGGGRVHRRGRDHGHPQPGPVRASWRHIEDTNFAFWHSATFSNDGKKVLFTDELGGGSQAVCNTTVGPYRGADGIYDITDPANPRFLSYFKIPRAQTNTENYIAHRTGT